MKITSKTGLLAVLGNPIRHSMSPMIHNFLIKELNLDYVYIAIEPDNIHDALDAVRSLGMKGVNITAPFKTDALECVDVLDESVNFSGSVNTVVNNDGMLSGFSTDGEGLFRAIKDMDISLKNKNVLILGTGGASEAVCSMLYSKNVANVYVKNRTLSKQTSFILRLNKRFDTDIFKPFSPGDKADIVINATSVGMCTDESPISDYSCFDGAEACIDLIYNPRKTSFLKAAENAGLKTMNGIGMLVYQAILSFEHFTQVKVPDSLCKEVFKLFDE